MQGTLEVAGGTVARCKELWGLRSAISGETKGYGGYRHWLAAREVVDIIRGGEKVGWSGGKAGREVLYMYWSRGKVSMRGEIMAYLI